MTKADINQELSQAPLKPRSVMSLLAVPLLSCRVLPWADTESQSPTGSSREPDCLLLVFPLRRAGFRVTERTKDKEKYTSSDELGGRTMTLSS